MSTLYMMTAVLERSRLHEYLEFYRKNNLSVHLVKLGYGTARHSVLDQLGLEQTEKAVVASLVTSETWERIKKAMEIELQIDLPGRGIAFAIPLSGIGGRPQMQFLLGGQNYEKKEESEMTGTIYELIVVVSNIGYSDAVMDAARKAGAGGGTVVHAKGTGMKGSEAFFGVTLASEKEMIYIVVKSQNRNEIMKAIMEENGIRKKAQAICFSLPVTDVAGMRFQEMMEETASEE